MDWWVVLCNSLDQKPFWKKRVAGIKVPDALWENMAAIVQDIMETLRSGLNIWKTDFWGICFCELNAGNEHWLLIGSDF
ncbi:hypothetical protein TNCT_654901 [Trichonephila clavata]|uniref:Uncharacterized protein n=1 Tax=Trichonephila clavata TaxID=2740835 RepID=A0A8X6LTS1_TRICU|nr:hypothetical protein TNCT_654901 [Trichonephila clavata]